MKLVTFEVSTLLGPFTRLGALQESVVVDLNIAAAARWAGLGQPEPRRLADTLLPPDMVAFLELGRDALAEARHALEFAAAETEKRGAPAGPRGERVCHDVGSVRILAPLQPRSLRDFFAYEDHAV